MNTLKSIVDKLVDWAFKFFNYFGVDGIMHILICTMLVSVFKLFFPLWISIVITAVIGLGKEFIYDLYMKKGECSKKDLLADLIGILLGSL